MSITLRMDGLESLQADLRRASADARARVDDAINGTGVELVGEIQKAYLSGPASGRVYELYDPRRTHKASAPGEAPATDQGDLVKYTLFESVSPLAVTVFLDGVVGIRGAALEFGTSRIDPRPVWVPAVEKMTPKFVRRVERALEEAFR